MKRLLLNAIATLACGASLCSTALWAQTRQTAAIPFAFEAGGVEYVEGNYAIERMSRMIKLTNIASGRSAVVPTPVLSGQANNDSQKLVFTRSANGSLQLKQVWFAGHPRMETWATSKDASAKVTVNLK